ncbi:MAG: AAA domain-containing protein [Gammaproteobacteria bacterium]|nr:AAA domain-containing protein [Gammaproteobacteria bacterium]MDH5799518.1 AAA domain-containing protein [Gammaproteobacteria bacterium]
MSKLEHYLNEQTDQPFLTSDAVVHAMLPLIKQLLETHEAGQVAPLQGLGELHIENAGIWYAIKDAKPPSYAKSALRRVDPPHKGALRIVSESSHLSDLNEGSEVHRDHSIAERTDKITAPVYLPGYICWEHQLEHHDPLSDIFVIGLILASLACNLDLNNSEDLQLFVENRHNLFAINSDLNPVIAKVIVQTTELSRHVRLADLESLYRSLKNYRDQDSDIDFELLRVGGFDKKKVDEKQQIILGKLQERLFEISKRNKLLHFSATQNMVNLTQASVPLSCDVQNIKADSLLTWGHSFKEDILKEKPTLLNKYVNTLEALYVPGSLDRLRTEANRDQQEFGFAQLRLVLCFLSWTNLKESNKERFYSPLVLLPVELSKKKGVKDKYWLQSLSTEAEINPVLRHQFGELYDIHLPDSIDLKKTDLVEFHQWLRAQIESSDQSITLELIDKPKVDIVHAAAKRRLDHYNRRAGLSGRGIVKYEDIDYSYKAGNFHPLGLRLFNQRIRKTPTYLQRIVGDVSSVDMQYMVQLPGASVGSEQKKTKAFYSLRENDETNPYRWQYDICNVTLGNFKYRKMSLVKDYTRLLESPQHNQAFEATFSLNPRPLSHHSEKEADLSQQFHIVPCDPTQSEAIALAKRGESYIIQGPPGTGKSQTITNLIADFIARGKKILFVCEKRAAIDIVYLRLKQQGLGAICSLIHDSQTDKKRFILDLRATYEGFLEFDSAGNADAQAQRKDIVVRLNESLEPLKRFDSHMTQVYDSAGIPLNQLLELAIRNKHLLPQFSVLEFERFPEYAQWEMHRAPLTELQAAIGEIQEDGILAKHPLVLLHEQFIDHAEPMNTAAQLIDSALSTLQSLQERLAGYNQKAGFAAADFTTVAELQQLLAYTQSIKPLAQAKLNCLFDDSHALTQRFESARKKYLKKLEQYKKAQDKTQHWRNKLAPEETEAALAQASGVGGVLAFLSPTWWKLRKVLNLHYDFSAHQIKPKWVQVLTWLLDEHKALVVLEDFVDDMKIDFGFDCELEELNTTLEAVSRDLPDYTQSLQRLHENLVTHADARDIIAGYASLKPSFVEFGETLSQLVQAYEEIPYSELKLILAGMKDALHQVPEFLLCLKALAGLPLSLSALFRTHKLTSSQIETAIAHKTVTALIKTQPALNRIVGTVKQQHVKTLGKYHGALYKQNAHAILDQVRSHFLHNLHVSNLAAAELSSEQKEFKKRYARGRRELEHEFGKSIRYKSIRDMVSNASGEVINDLKRVWLMSPLSVSDTLPLSSDDFDVVIFDEASQITLEEAIPSIFRANQSVVVGDQMQMPPTNFFSAKSGGGEEEVLEFYEDDELVEYDLNSNSFLTHVANNLESRRLGWHYRSRSEALISFSNWAFYQGSLLTVPDVVANSDSKAAIVVFDSQQGDQNHNRILDRGVSFHRIEKGIYENRRNRREADYIARLVRGLLTSQAHKSIGIVAFSEAQQTEIERALNALAEHDRDFRNLLDAEFEREEDGEFVGLLVKNLENIQGDERDIIILSVCYGHNPQGKMRMNFGPINQKGGEKRLNVAFSRAKQHMVVISSIQHADITNDYNEGANALKSYLRYTEAVSVGDEESANRVLFGLSYSDLGSGSENAATDGAVNPCLIQLQSALEQQGWVVDAGVGHSRFKCDMALRRPEETHYRLGIFIDGDHFYQQQDVIERDLLKPQLLRNFGWRIVHVLLKDWYDDPESVLAQIDKALTQPEAEEAVEDTIELGPVQPESTNTVAPVYAEPVQEFMQEPVQKPIGDNAAVPEELKDKSEPLKSLDDSVKTPSTTAPQPSSSPSTRSTPTPTPSTLDPPEVVLGKTVYLEFVSASSAKFWSITVSDKQHEVCFGRIGTKGQGKVQQFETTTAALGSATKLLAQKLKKGYVVVGQ